MPADARPSLESLGLPTAEVRALVERALAEDRGQGDLTTRLTVAEGTRARGTFFSKQRLVVAGLPVAALVFEVLDSSRAWKAHAQDGAEVAAGTPLGEVSGPAAPLLAGERVALNFLQHLSGIATLAWQLKQQLEGLRVQLLDTRKTLPGLRNLEKYAVRMGGGRNHRMRLDDGILIKNNHLRMAGGIRAALERARRNRPQGFQIEIEISSTEELEEAVRNGADVVLLDNMTPEQVRQCVARAAGRARLEVSGGIDAGNIRAYGETGVDYISVGALTHSAPAADINFRLEPV